MNGEKDQAEKTETAEEKQGVVLRVVSVIIPPALRLRIKALGKNRKSSDRAPDTDYSKRNVMIGMLRNPRQLNKNLRGNFYHIPSKLLHKNENEIKYVAIYQSKNLFGRLGGIRYYGEVEYIVPKKRCDIREIPSKSEEIYDYIRIKEWKLLNRAVKAKECRSPVFFTTEYLLKTSEITSELFFRSEKEHKLYKLLKALFENGSGEEKISAGKTELEKHDGVIEVRLNGEYLTTVSFDDFSARPYEVTNDLYKLIG